MKHLAYPSLLVLSLTLAACGGGSGGTADGAASASGVQAQAASSATSTAVPAGTTSATPTTTAATSATASTVSPPAASTSTTASPSTTPATSTTAATTTTVPAASSGEPKIVEYYGDSTVWGYRSGSGDQVAKPAPAAFAEALPNPSAYNVRNEGVSGSTACGLLNGTDGKHPAWSTQMANSKATYVFINHGINDEWKYDLNTYKSCLHSLAQTAKQYGKQMIFETPNPTQNSGPNAQDIWVDAMREVASQENVPVVDQYKYLTDYLKGQSPYTICPDGLHPTEDVYVMKGRYSAGVFASLFK